MRPAVSYLCGPCRYFRLSPDPTRRCHTQHPSSLGSCPARLLPQIANPDKSSSSYHAELGRQHQVWRTGRSGCSPPTRAPCISGRRATSRGDADRRGHRRLRARIRFPEAARLHPESARSAAPGKLDFNLRLEAGLQYHFTKSLTGKLFYVDKSFTKLADGYSHAVPGAERVRDPDLPTGRPEELLGPDPRRHPQAQVRVGEALRGGSSGPAPGPRVSASPEWCKCPTGASAPLGYTGRQSPPARNPAKRRYLT